MTNRVNVRLSAAEAARWKKAAGKEHRTLSDYVRVTVNLAEATARELHELRQACRINSDEWKQRVESMEQELAAVTVRNATLRRLIEESWTKSFPCEVYRDGKIDELTGELISVKNERDQLRELLRQRNASPSDVALAVDRFWFDTARPIINAIGEISVQEAMTAIERLLERGGQQ